MIDHLLCHYDKTLLDAMQKINLNGKGTLFIVDDHQRLWGVLTDGDIRRSLLEKHDLQEKILNVIKKDFFYATIHQKYKEIMQKKPSGVHMVPIVDHELKVVDYYELRSQLHVPLVSPSLKETEFKYLVDAFLSTWISSQGTYIERFEKEFSHYCECRYGMAVSNGTAALHLALLSLGIGKNHEVIIPDLTFGATINAVLHTGSTPVVVDIERDSWCIDPKEIEKAITPRTKAIIPVHLYGQPCDMDAILTIAKKHDLFVIEDCAQAHGATFDGKKVGSMGHIGCFSFFGNKIITTGEGGMCVTQLENVQEKIRILRDHGMNRKKKYWHDVVGFNYRMTNLQAAIGVAQLERIDEILKARKEQEEGYRKYLSELPEIEFQRNDLPKRKKVTWLVSLLVKHDKRDDWIKNIKEKGIDVRSFFYSLTEMDIYKKYSFSNKISLEISKQGVNLPTHPMVEKNILHLMKEIWIKNE